MAACAANSLQPICGAYLGPSTLRGSDEARHQGAKDKLEIPLVRSPFCARRPWACSHAADANTAKKWWLVARDYGLMTPLLPSSRFEPVPSSLRFALDNSNRGTPLLVLGIEQRLDRLLPNAVPISLPLQGTCLSSPSSRRAF